MPFIIEGVEGVIFVTLEKENVFINVITVYDCCIVILITLVMGAR